MTLHNAVAAAREVTLHKVTAAAEGLTTFTLKKYFFGEKSQYNFVRRAHLDC